MEKCRWVYRPGTSNSFWAKAECNREYMYLSKIPDTENNERIGCADLYNGKTCPVRGKQIQVVYDDKMRV